MGSIFCRRWILTTIESSKSRRLRLMGSSVVAKTPVMMKRWPKMVKVLPMGSVVLKSLRERDLPITADLREELLWSLRKEPDLSGRWVILTKSGVVPRILTESIVCLALTVREVIESGATAVTESRRLIDLT